MTIDDEFHGKIGRMTVACGELDFAVSSLAARMTEMLGQADSQPFTARKLDDIKACARWHGDRLDADLVDELVSLAGDIKGRLKRRRDAVHGLWLQEDDASTAWALKLPKGSRLGEPSNADAARVDQITDEAKALDLRTWQVLKQLDQGTNEHKGQAT
jgi:hypothetical protein